MKAQPALPEELFVQIGDKGDQFKEQLVVTPELDRLFPGVESAFMAADKAYENDPEAYMEALGASLSSFTSSNGTEVPFSLLPGKGKELLVMIAAISDGAPTSEAQTIYSYMSEDSDVKKSDAGPNSWSQLTKSGVMSSVLKAVDREMTVLTIFGPIPPKAYSREERQAMKEGDFRPAGRIVAEAVAAAQDQIHGPDSETQFSDLHVHGISKGASIAVGSAVTLEQSGDYNLKSLTAQELVAAPIAVFPDLMLRYSVAQNKGEASDLILPSEYARIAEPLVRRLVTRGGNELKTYTRMASGIVRPGALRGMTHPGTNLVLDHIEAIAAKNIAVALPIAEHSALTYNLPDYLSGAGEQVIKLRAARKAADKKPEILNHIANEFVTPTTTAGVMNIQTTKR